MPNESEVRLRAILETAVEGIITINGRGIITSFNPASERMFGFSSDEVIGENVNVLMPSPYREEHDGYLAAYLRSGEKKIIDIGREVIGQRKDGSTFPMYLSVGEFRIHDQRFFTGIVRDLSTEKRTRKLLQRSDEKMRAIFDTVVEGILTIDKHGTVKSMNPAAIRLFGYEAEEVLGQSVKMLAPPPFRNEHDSYLASYVSTGVKKIIGVGREVLGQRKDGTTFPMFLSVGEMWLENEQYFTGIVRDLTEVKQAQQRETEVGRILEDSLNEIYIFDAESLKFIQVNKGARENLDYTHDELTRLTPLDLKPEFTVDRFNQLIEPLRTGEEQQVVFQTVHKRKDGSSYPVEVHLQLTYFLSRRAFVAIILDTTERHEAEAKLLQSERLAAIGQVVSGVAHESRNALQRMRAGVELAEMDAAGNDELSKHLKNIGRAADDLESLLEEVRNYAAPIVLENSVSCIASVWRTAWTNLAIEIEQSGRDASLDEFVGAADTQCDIDRFRMDQVFRNLFENSLAACSDPVRIRIDCSADRARGILRISVRDNGKGIDLQQRAKVFDAFYTTKKTGTGLGMAITKRIIEAHGGTIVIGEPDKGAEFVIDLPQTQNSETPGTKSQASRRTKKRI